MVSQTMTRDHCIENKVCDFNVDDLKGYSIKQANTKTEDWYSSSPFKRESFDDKNSNGNSQSGHGPKSVPDRQSFPHRIAAME